MSSTSLVISSITMLFQILCTLESHYVSMTTISKCGLRQIVVVNLMCLGKFSLSLSSIFTLVLRHTCPLWSLYIWYEIFASQAHTSNIGLASLSPLLYWIHVLSFFPEASCAIRKFNTTTTQLWKSRLFFYVRIKVLFVYFFLLSDI